MRKLDAVSARQHVAEFVIAFWVMPVEPTLYLGNLDMGTFHLTDDAGRPVSR